MGGKFEVSAGKHYWKLADRLSRDGLRARPEMLVGRLADPWYVPAKAVQAGDRSNVCPQRDGRLTGHISGSTRAGYLTNDKIW